MNNEKTLDISWGTIFKISIAVVFIYFVYLIRDLIIWFIFALVISILFEPVISLLIKRRVPRVVATASVYFFIFGILTYAFYLSLPFFISEIQRFSEIFPQRLPGYFERISPMFKQLGIETFENFEVFLTNLRKPFEEMARNIFSTLITFFGGVFAVFFTISMAFFLSLESGLMEKGLTLFFPKKYETFLFNLWNRSKEKVVGWFLMRIIGMIFVGLTSYVAFRFLEVNYPVSLAAMIGIFDFVPIIGPLVATIFIMVVVSIDSFLKAAFVFAAIVLIELIENGVLFPALSRKIIKVPSIIVLVGLFVGGKLWGVLGAVLAIPLFAILFEFFKDFLKEKKEELFLRFSSKEDTNQ